MASHELHESRGSAGFLWHRISCAGVGQMEGIGESDGSIGSGDSRGGGCSDGSDSDGSGGSGGSSGSSGATFFAAKNGTTAPLN